MDLFNCITAFVKAVDHGSFSAAARQLRISPQLLGKYVERLEDRLGAKLLHRTTRKHMLTEFGHDYLRHARTILAQVAAADTLAASISAEPAGLLRVNAPVSFGMSSLGPVLPEFMRVHPKLRVDLTLSNRISDLMQGGFDIAFRVGDLDDSGLMARALADYHLILCAAPSYLRSAPHLNAPNDLRNHECLGFAHKELLTRWTFDGPEGSEEVPIDSRLTSNHGEPLLNAALAGMGVILQPRELVLPYVQDGRLRQLLPEFRPSSRSMHILYHSDRQMVPKIRSFIDFAVRMFGRTS